MMRFAITAGFLTAAALTGSASASSYPLTLTGTDVIQQSVDFSLDPSTATVSNGVYTFSQVSGTFNGTPDTFTIAITPQGTATFTDLEISDPTGLSGLFVINGNNLPAPEVGATEFFTPGSFNVGSYSGSVSGIPVTLVVGSPATSAAVTPEPSSVFLLATGALGMAGMVRRRLQA